MTEGLRPAGEAFARIAEQLRLGVSAPARTAEETTPHPAPKPVAPVRKPAPAPHLGRRIDVKA